MLPIDLFDYIGHQLQNKYSAAKFWKKNPFSVSTQLTMRKYISVYCVSVHSVSVYSVSVYSVLNVAIMWSFEGTCDGKCDCNICRTAA